MNDISQALEWIESKHHCKILCAVESGSRAWGFASPDSDYDIRGIYIKPLDWYLQLDTNPADTIIENLPGEKDVSLWDLRKAFLQMTKSNASLFEWLGSPIVYKGESFLASLRPLANACFNPLHVAHHYSSMFRKAMETQNEEGVLRLKKLCYGLRANLCVRFILEKATMPPTAFSDLLAQLSFTQKEQRAIETLLKQKQNAKESDTTHIDPDLLTLLQDPLEAVRLQTWSPSTYNAEIRCQLEALFQAYVKQPF